MIDWIEIFGLSGLVFVFGFPYLHHKKAKTWFRGWGACDFFGCYFGHGKPREGQINHDGSTRWLCDSHYVEDQAIKNMVDRLYNKEISKEQFAKWRGWKS